MSKIAIVATLDTKGSEIVFLKNEINQRGAEVVIVDCGVMADPPFEPDISSSEIARLGGMELEELRRKKDRGLSVQVMGQGARKKMQELLDQGQIQGVIGAGGSGNTFIAAQAVSELPIGFPKLIVSTLASGDVSKYVGIRDVTMMYSVADIEGINQLTTMILRNAAGAVVGMALGGPPPVTEKTTIGITMFGVTTQAVKAIRKQLEEQGFEVLVFHAVGTGGRAMEALIREGVIQGVIDLTTTEIADEVVGGVLSSGPDRLKAAVSMGIPHVIAPGALDMVNFGARETVPERFEERNLYVHNPQVTLMRTTPEENEKFAQFMAHNLQGADLSTVRILLPLRGFSVIDQEGEAFWNPASNQRFFEVLKQELPDGFPLVEVDANINDQLFADRIVQEFLLVFREARHQKEGPPSTCRSRSGRKG